MFKRSDIWWTCISHNGRKIQKSLETSDKRLAQAIEAKIRTEIVEGKYYERLTGQCKTSHKPFMCINWEVPRT